MFGASLCFGGNPFLPPVSCNPRVFSLPPRGSVGEKRHRGPSGGNRSTWGKIPPCSGSARGKPRLRRVFSLPGVIPSPPSLPGLLQTWTARRGMFAPGASQGAAAGEDAEAAVGTVCVSPDLEPRGSPGVGRRSGTRPGNQRRVQGSPGKQQRIFSPLSQTS